MFGRFVNSNEYIYITWKFFQFKHRRATAIQERDILI